MRQPRLQLALLLLALSLAACREHRVEHHTRPDFYAKASQAPLPDEVVLDDGTIIKYHSVSDQSTFGRLGAEKHKPLEIREEREDGKIILRNLVPEHLLANTLACLQKEEYQLIYDQLLADETKATYEEKGQGAEDVAVFLKKYRHDIAGTLSRMIAALPNQEVRIERREPYVRCTLRPQIAGPFKFKVVDMVKEGQQLKLKVIQ
jgi:hypothetical protein